MLSVLHYHSDCLSRCTELNVLLPDNKPLSECPVVMLLHGMHGTYDDWLRKTTVEIYAKTKGIAVVMPDGENSFYQNMKYGPRFYDMIIEEIPDLMERTFGLSKKREMNYIAGLSMGGYGAFRTALLNPDRYAGAVSLSGALDMASRLRTAEKDDPWNAIWGEDFRKTMVGTDLDIVHLIRTFPAGKQAPKLFLSCGTQDFLYETHTKIKSELESRSDVFEFAAEEGPGVHNWFFWENWIGSGLDFVME